jgi:hypothetical protein
LSHLGNHESGTFLGQAHGLTDPRASFSCGTGLQVAGDGNSRKDADDSHNDHQLDQGETLL